MATTYSMTGFARVRRLAGGADVILSIKSVNHRGLDVHFHMPPVLDPFEPLARSAIKKKVNRGHLQVHAAIERSVSEATGTVNEPLLERWLTAFHVVATKSGSTARPDPHDALRVPGMLLAESAFDWSNEVEQCLGELLAEALDALNEFRLREGLEIAKEMRERVASVRGAANGLEQIRSTATEALQTRLKEKLLELLATSTLDPQRLAQEAAILADRSDISEEIMRLRTHATQLGELLNADGEKGKKLDFLLQEMSRESNTILSKTSGLGDHGLKLTDLALVAKAEIEKMREQALNVE